MEMNILILTIPGNFRDENFHCRIIPTIPENFGNGNEFTWGFRIPKKIPKFFLKTSRKKRSFFSKVGNFFGNFGIPLKMSIFPLE